MKIIISFLIFFCIGFQTANSDAIIGQWENPDGTRRIEIFKGEKAYLGKVVWLKVKEPKAKPGDIVLDDFQFQDSYWNGKITLPGKVIFLMLNCGCSLGIGWKLKCFTTI
ncbi:hypothetical protein DI487_11300 [Flavobacterium sediminis]|uniref:Uncharacterized protein n=1 Tax=Flavobacterium sediminis TaxID=2201181 RepID=A0A2U8QW88_9FLAO|nr:DUF2147 domain-containing protein [Flavobacterium sediminis]AWM14383.1 hypothetical protein DI487_11300 [Flavobacterium sediminis]